jgi:hypothetical protein
VTLVAINKNRRTERRAINALRTLLEAHDHIVQEIDGGNDHGEDLYVTFTEKGQRTGDTIAVQVKGGKSFKAGGGYRVPIGDHADFWRKSNLAIFCVVQDAETGVLYWGNASQQLREKPTKGQTPRSIFIREADSLDGSNLVRFSQLVRNYIAETAELHRFLAKISGCTFDTTDYLAYFVNEHREQLIFLQRRGEPFSWLLHSDLDWEPQLVSPDTLRFGRPDLQGEHSVSDDFLSKLITVGNVVIDHAEASWLAACFFASTWYREQPKMRRS